MSVDGISTWMVFDLSKETFDPTQKRLTYSVDVGLSQTSALSGQ